MARRDGEATAGREPRRGAAGGNATEESVREENSETGFSRGCASAARHLGPKLFPSPHGFAQPLFNLPESFERLPLERFTLAKRGLDDAGAKSNEEFNVYDINFREVLDTVVDGAIYLRALGLGDWDVHGWVGALQDIPRAGHGAGMAT